MRLSSSAQRIRREQWSVDVSIVSGRSGRLAVGSGRGRLESWLLELPGHAAHRLPVSAADRVPEQHYCRVVVGVRAEVRLDALTSHGAELLGHRPTLLVRPILGQVDVVIAAEELVQLIFERNDSDVGDDRAMDARNWSVMPRS